MISVNMHEAKSRLSELVKALEVGGEIAILQRNGVPVAEIRALSCAAPLDHRRIAPDPMLHVELIQGYDPAEPPTEDEWPSEVRMSGRRMEDRSFGMGVNQGGSK